ncbi:MAG: hypothetical protein D6732_04650, partial [Methanobacteriota archaeon]
MNKYSFLAVLVFIALSSLRGYAQSNPPPSVLEGVNSKTLLTSNQPTLMIPYATLENVPMVSFSGSRELSWVRHYAFNPVEVETYPRAIAMDAQGNVYLTGHISSDVLVTKYTNQGELIWMRQFVEASYTAGEGVDITIDTNGNAYVAARFSKVYPVNKSNIGLLKYSVSGNLLWESLDSLILSDLSSVPLKLFLYGDYIYVAGTAYQPGYGADFLLEKIDTLGNFVWFRRFNTSGNNYEWIRDFVIDSDGNSVILGRTNSSTLSPDICVVKYDQNGQLLWSYIYDYQGGTEEPFALAIDSQNNIIISGHTFSPGQA